MALTAKEIQSFARVAVGHHSDIFTAKTPERKAYCIRQHRLAAREYYASAQADVQASGFRVTQRVKNILWAELEKIAADEEAAQPRIAA